MDQLVVEAVDRNARDIAFARRATYARRALRVDAPDWAAPWFRSEGEQLHVAPVIVKAIRWIVADVLHAPLATFQEHYDVIFCRNLLIYLHGSAREQLIERLANWLTERGLLFVGHAERIEAMQSRFQFAPTPHAFALRTLPRQSVPSPTVADREVRRIEPRGRRSVGPAAEPSNQPTDRVPAFAADSRSEQPPAAIRGDATSSISHQRIDSVVTCDSPRELAALRDARRLADGGQLPEALEAIETIIADCEPDAGAYSLLGSVHLALGNLAAAQEAFLKSVYLAPRCEDTLLQLALVYDRQGKGPLAARYRRRAAEVHRGTAQEGL
jgi:chemotaxis protein methyltransferase WspC